MHPHVHFFFWYSVECFDLIYPLDCTRGPPVIISSQGKQPTGKGRWWSCAEVHPIFIDTFADVCFRYQSPAGLDVTTLATQFCTQAHHRRCFIFSCSNCNGRGAFQGDLKRWILFRLPRPPASHIFDILRLAGARNEFVKGPFQESFLKMFGWMFFFSGFTTLNSVKSGKILRIRTQNIRIAREQWSLEAANFSKLARMLNKSWYLYCFHTYIKKTQTILTHLCTKNRLILKWLYGMMFLQTWTQQQSLPSKRWNISPQQQPAHHHCYLQVTLAGGVGNPDTEAPGKKAELNPTDGTGYENPFEGCCSWSDDKLSWN